MNNYRGWETELPENAWFLEHVESSFEADNHMFTKSPPPPCLVAFPAGYLLEIRHGRGTMDL